MDSSKYIALYLIKMNMSARALTRKLGYSKNIVSGWVSGKPISKYAMSHLELFRKSKSGSKIKPYSICSNTGSGLDENAKIIADIIYFTDSEDRINLLLTISRHLKKNNINYTAELFKKIGVEYRRNYYE